MNDPLFNEKNAAPVKKGMRGSAFYGPKDMPGGRMRWWRLKEGKCPRCSYMLATEGGGNVMKCENYYCTFAITSRRMKQIVDSMDEPDRSEEANQGYLNNL